VDSEVLALFAGYSWPGNVRELANVLERAALLAKEGGNITRREVFLPQEQVYPEDAILPLDEARQLMVNKALHRYGSTVAGKKEAAKALSVSLTTLYNYLRSTGTLKVSIHANTGTTRGRPAKIKR
jgi:transcriptional regulator with PAS, ATPase and Fis domain